MRADLRDHVRLLLRQEPTRSLPLGVLRERLRPAAGDALPGPIQLEQALGADASFRLLNPLPLLDPVPGSYSRALRAVGVPQMEPRVVLLEDAPPGAGPHLLDVAGDSLLALVHAPELHASLAEALAELADIAERVTAAECTLNAAAARSTTPLPGPPAPPPGRPSRRTPAARRPPTGGSR